MPHKINSEDVFDGGFVANNPTLYAITDAIKALNKKAHQIRVLNIGVGGYPHKSINLQESILRRIGFANSSLELFETVISSNNNAAEELRKIIFPDIVTFRGNKDFSDKAYATNFLESDQAKLQKINSLGLEFFRENESEIKEILNI
jgi:uncharacterized protein